MEIIKDNYNLDELVYVQCKHCNSMLKCTKEELESLCPCCGKSLSKSDILEEKTFVSPTQEKFSVVCENCEKTFTYKLEDCTVGIFGIYHTRCPHCGKMVPTDQEIEITADNLKEFHFYDMHSGVPIPFSDIKNWIKRGINFLKANPEEHLHYTCSGNSFIFIIRDDDQFIVIYTDSYKEAILY